MSTRLPRIGDTVTFTPRFRYGAPGTDPLRGTVTRTFYPVYSPNAYWLELHCTDNGIRYGMCPWQVTRDENKEG